MYLPQAGEQIKYLIVAHYTKRMYEGMGYVTLSYLMDITGLDHVEIIDILYQLGFVDNPVDSNTWVLESDI